MKASEQLWELLKESEQTTKSEATEFFAEAICSLLPLDQSNATDGTVLDALEFALDYLTSTSKHHKKLFNRYIEEVFD